MSPCVFHRNDLGLMATWLQPKQTTYPHMALSTCGYTSVHLSLSWLSLFLPPPSSTLSSFISLPLLSSPILSLLFFFSLVPFLGRAVTAEPVWIE